jgi:hypothetical protein
LDDNDAETKDKGNSEKREGKVRYSKKSCGDAEGTTHVTKPYKISGKRALKRSTAS